MTVKNYIRSKFYQNTLNLVLNITLKNIFYNQTFYWKKYIFPQVVTADDRMQVFQYKLLNIWFLKKMWFKFGIVSQSLYSFCNSEEETLFYIFHTHTQNLWNQLQTYISQNIVILCWTTQSTMFGFIDTQLQIQDYNNTCSSLKCVLFILNWEIYQKRHFLKCP